MKVAKSTNPSSAAVMLPPSMIEILSAGVDVAGRQHRADRAARQQRAGRQLEARRRDGLDRGRCLTAAARGAARFTRRRILTRFLGFAARRLALAQAVLPEQAVEVDAIDARRAGRRADAVLVLAQQLFEVAALERAHPGLARLAQRLADVDGALRAGHRRASRPALRGGAKSCSATQRSR